MDTSVIDLPAPVAARLRRPGWRDPRLLAGIAMVAASVLLGSWVVRTAQATVPVYVSRAALVPGDRLEAGQLSVVDVRLGTVDLDHYLRADEPLTDAVVVRVVGRGELVPASAVGDAADLDLRPVSVTLERTPSQDVTEGAQVDLWFTPTPPTGEDAGPTRPRPARDRPRRGRGDHAGRCVQRRRRDAGAGARPERSAAGHPHGARGRRHPRRGARPGHGWLTCRSGCSARCTAPRSRSSCRPSSARAGG